MKDRITYTDDRGVAISFAKTADKIDITDRYGVTVSIPESTFLDILWRIKGIDLNDNSRTAKL